MARSSSPIGPMMATMRLVGRVPEARRRGRPWAPVAAGDFPQVPGQLADFRAVGGGVEEAAGVPAAGFKPPEELPALELCSRSSSGVPLCQPRGLLENGADLNLQTGSSWWWSGKPCTALAYGSRRPSRGGPTTSRRLAKSTTTTRPRNSSFPAMASIRPPVDSQSRSIISMV